ncbi:MAG: CotH protein [Aeromicrobium sp.]|nr:CotH protein [Aeromicrobium sp.]
MRRPALVIAAILSLSGLTFVASATAAEPIPAPTASVADPWVGQQITMTGDVTTPVVRAVELQYKSGSSWKKVTSGKTAAEGTYALKVTQTVATRDYRVIAAKSGSNPALTSAPTTVVTRADKVSSPILSRDGSSIVARGVADPILPGRLFRLEYKSGSSWKTLGSAAEDAGGGINVVAPSSGSRSYRLAADPQDGSTGAVSPTRTFDFGPAALGAHTIYVTTDSGKNPVKKGAVFPGTAVIDNGDPLRLETLSVRGNSTASKPKKPYKLKFEEKQGPFGFSKDKTWILLANYLDRTYVRSDAAWDLADSLANGRWNPKRQFTELYINGKYQGSYELVQSIKIDSKRVNVAKPTGQIIEIDPHYKADGVPGFIGQSKLPFSFKDPDEYKKLPDGVTDDPEGLTAARVTGMRTKIQQFEKVLYAKDWSKVDFDTLAPADDWKTYLDLDAAVDYYLVKEFTKDQDADFFRSNYFYTNNFDPNAADKLIMGPLWDFDRSAGAASNEKTTIASTSGWWIRGNGSAAHNTNKVHWYTRITKDPRFLAALSQRWAATKDRFKAVSVTGVDASVVELGTMVAENDRVRWASSGSRYPAYTSSFTKEVAWLKNWYAGRYAWMDMNIPAPPAG